MSVGRQILSQYSFNPAKPKNVYSNLSVFDATSKQTKLPYTIKIIKNPEYKLEQYFKVIKTISSDYVIKIFEFAFDSMQNRMIIVQEQCVYGNLKKALHKCKRLQDDDSVYISKMLLNGHIDLLRAGINWFGNENDIQFTQLGLKLSWNNSMNYTNTCPFPEMLTRLGIRTNESTILPFPKNKQLNDLIAVSKENASEISLHPILKKKDKLVKKKGKKWLGIRQFKVKGEYFQELSYLAVSQQYGFIRVKVMDVGQYDKQLIKLHQTKASFVKILDYYQQNQSFYTISQYANDGTLQNYVKRLKNNNMTLQENQIQFFFFSMIQPLKFIHDTKVISLNMLHIRNIYIESGIPKIGEPVIVTDSLKQSLNERAEVPDFYFKQFKFNSNLKDPKFDTYSLGVLLYKLMYTQYPIFPNQEVHIPSAPSYKKNLKLALTLFLNKGGKLNQLEQQLQISDDVKLQVKNNQKILEQVTNKNKQATKIQQSNKHQDSEIQFQEQRNEAEDQNIGLLSRLYRWLTTRGKDTKGKYSFMHKSEFDGYRKCTTIFVILLFYFFVFFFFFMEGVINLLSYTPLFTPYSVTIQGSNHYIVTPNFYNFSTEYNLVKDDKLTTLNTTMGCMVDDQLLIYDFIRPQSPHWYIYLGLGVAAMITFLILKGSQLYIYSTVRAGYHHYDATLQGSNMSRFAISSFVFFHLWQAMSLYCFYYLFNIIFNQKHLPCFGKIDWTNLTIDLMNDRVKFATNYLIILLVCFLFNILSYAQLKNYGRIRYSMIINPIFIFTVPYLVLFIMMRVGALNSFVPSFVSNQSGIIGNSYLNIIGYFPQMMVLIEIALCLVIDLIFHKVMQDKIQKFILKESHSEQLKLAN